MNPFLHSFQLHSAHSRTKRTSAIKHPNSVAEGYGVLSKRRRRGHDSTTASQPCKDFTYKGNYQDRHTWSSDSVSELGTLKTLVSLVTENQWHEL